jgi:hypothetical protein
LQDLANLRAGTPGTNKEVNYDGARHLLRLHGDWFPPSFPQDSALRRVTEQDDAELTQGVFVPELTAREQEELSLSAVFELAEKLRKAWDAGPSLRMKERAIFELRKFYDRAISLESAPAPISFDQAVVHFQRIADRAKHCPNDVKYQDGGTCLNPYFIAAKRSYKYCHGNPECAATAQQSATRKWWSDHGTQWRKSREAAQKKSQKKGRKYGKR